MFGTLRLLLAMTVVMSHIGMSWPTFWPGIIAVSIFYIISGYAMTALIDARFSERGSAPRFYLERFIRLAPQYYFWLGASILVYAVVGWPSLGGRPPRPFDFFAYITVVPLGIQNYAWIINTLFMAVATTLAIEITFYVFSPWILRSRTLSYLAAAVSLSLIAAAAFKWMPPAVFTYYNSPGPMVFFIMGSFLRRREWIGLLTIAAATVVFCVIGAPAMTNIEFIAATLIGVPLVMLAAHVKPSKLDEALGNASYGCFVSHSLILFPVMNYLFAVESYATVTVRIIAAIGCACVGYLTFLLVEQPTVAYRRRLRGASNNAASPSVSLPDREKTKSSASAIST